MLLTFWELSLNCWTVTNLSVSSSPNWEFRSRVNMHRLIYKQDKLWTWVFLRAFRDWVSLSIWAGIRIRLILLTLGLLQDFALSLLCTLYWMPPVCGIESSYIHRITALIKYSFAICRIKLKLFGKVFLIPSR